MRNHRSETGLMIASAHGAFETVEVFIDQNSDLEARDAKGKTALLHAAENGFHKVMKKLFDCGANAQAKTVKQETAYHLISNSGELLC